MELCRGYRDERLVQKEKKIYPEGEGMKMAVVNTLLQKRQEQAAATKSRGCRWKLSYE